MNFLSKNKKLLLAFGIALLSLSFILVLNKTGQDILVEEVSLWIEEEKVLVLEVADTAAERKLGLSFRENLPENKGLLFVFETEDKHGIWMKDMSFPIDIIWLDKNFRVINFKERVSPETFPTVFTPNSQALYVLETNPGFIDEFSIKIGEILDIKKETSKK